MLQPVQEGPILGWLRVGVVRRPDEDVGELVGALSARGAEVRVTTPAYMSVHSMADPQILCVSPTLWEDSPELRDFVRRDRRLRWTRVLDLNRQSVARASTHLYSRWSTLARTIAEKGSVRVRVEEYGPGQLLRFFAASDRWVKLSFEIPPHQVRVQALKGWVTSAATDDRVTEGLVGSEALKLLLGAKRGECLVSHGVDMHKMDVSLPVDEALRCEGCEGGAKEVFKDQTVELQLSHVAGGVEWWADMTTELAAPNSRSELVPTTTQIQLPDIKLG